MKGIIKFIADSIQALVLALSVFVLVYLFVAQPNQVKGNSMYPNFHNGDFVLTEKISYRFHPPRRGDVVVFKAPPSEPCAEDECEYIKRIIGLPGDVIRIRGGKIWINNKLLNEPYLPPEYQTQGGEFLPSGKPFVVPEGEYFVVGDNRSHSRDSRSFGPIPQNNIVGRAFFRYWPLTRFGLLPRVSYSMDKNSLQK